MYSLSPIRLVGHLWSGVWGKAYGLVAAVCGGSACNVAEAAVVSLLKTIRHGRLIIHTPSQTYIFPSPGDVSVSSPDEDILSAELTVRNPAFWLRLCSMGDLGFAEAYMYGEVDCDDLIRVFSVLVANRECLAALDSRLARIFRVPSRFAAARLVNSIANARSNISAHYDISNDMFKGFLSEDMTYSCAIYRDLDGDLPHRAEFEAFSTDKLGAYSRPVSPSNTAFPTPIPTIANFSGLSAPPSRSSHLGTLPSFNVQPDETGALHAAQMRKLRHIIRKADIRPGHRILEIGTGWGSMAVQIASTIPETTVDTLTLSTQQAELARERLHAVGLGDKKGVSGRVRVHLMDYRNMPAEWEGMFDRVVSVEMVEAVGHEYLETYWEKIDWALKKGTGVGVVQGITLPEARFEAYISDVDFIRKWSEHFTLEIWSRLGVLIDCSVFPGGFLPTVSLLISSLTHASGGRLVVESVSNIGPHYARTLREWRQRFEASFEDVIVPALMREHPDLMTGNGEEEEIDVFKRKWLYYFAYCEVGFTHRMIGDHILTFTREGNAEYGCQVYH